VFDLIVIMKHDTAALFIGLNVYVRLVLNVSTSTVHMLFPLHGKQSFSEFDILSTVYHIS
jgi:hypothetical protein